MIVLDNSTSFFRDLSLIDRSPFYREVMFLLEPGSVLQLEQSEIGSCIVDRINYIHICSDVDMNHFVGEAEHVETCLGNLFSDW